MEAKSHCQRLRESSHTDGGTVTTSRDETVPPSRGATMRAMKVALIAVVLLAAFLYTWALAPTCDTHISGPIQSTVHVAAPPSLPATPPLATWLDTMSTSDVPLFRAAAAYMVRLESEKGCDLESAKRQASWAKDDGRRRDIGICVQIRNDAAILDEYIAFHWLQGVGHFVIYDDNSNDDPWSVLRKYAALGIVEFFDMQGHPQAGTFRFQLHNINTCFTNLRERHAELGLRWLLFPDVDEFVLSNNRGQLLTELLNDRYTGVACTEIARTYYGTSFHHQRPHGLVTETYLLASPDFADGYPKMMANIYPEGTFQQNATRLHSVHNFDGQDKIPCRFKHDIKDIRINHYVRSLEDYERKVLTGHNGRYSSDPLGLFWERDRNELFSPIAADYACRVRGLIATISQMEKDGKIPNVQRPRPWNETQT